MSGKQYFELPKWIANKKACVNLKNTDDKCFFWALMASKYYDKVKATSNSATEIRHYKKFMSEIIEPEGCEYPVKISDVEKWENANNMKINVVKVMEEKEEFENVYIRNVNNENVVNLLLIEDGENTHYVWIKNINGLFASKTSHHTKFVCSQCLCKSFSSQEKLDEHIENKLCQSFNIEKEASIGIMPSGEDAQLKFKNVQNEFLHPFHVFADFESTLQRVNYEEDADSSTKRYQKHLQNSFGVKYNCIHEQYCSDVLIYNSPCPEQVSEEFIKVLEHFAKYSYDLLQLNKSPANMAMSEDQLNSFMNSTKCERCQCAYSNENKKVRHHDHISGQYIGALCNSCNMKFQYKPFLPVYIHNLKGYDAHLFVKSLFKHGYKHSGRGENITCIPNNEERYISFSKSIKVDEYEKDGEMKPIMFEIRFLDTIAFMATSIETLAENLNKDCKTIEDKRKVFKNVSKLFHDDRQFELMIKKGVYPYDYIDSYSRLHETRLPQQKDFYSELYNSEISPEDYQHALHVWYTFDCKTLLDYHNLYLKIDVLLLADIWENFRAVCYNIYKLDCEYYYTAPSLSFDAMLKYTEINLELLTDLDMFEFVERGIRGGISQISKRHAVANNKYIAKYDTSKEDSYIVYLDANNLYGYAMCEYLPVKDFKWNEDTWNSEKISELDDKGEKGYLFSVDLHYPEELHDYFNNYVPCPKNIVIKKSYLNSWQQAEYKESRVSKLCTTFFDKKNYIINYRYLKLVLSLGVQLVKVNKVLEYTQSDFMKKYIMLNTEKRQQSKNDFEKDFYKLMNNSVYGKTMENVRNRINFRLISTEEQAMRVKNLKRYTIFDGDLVGVHIQKMEVKLNKPIYLGQNILDDSKHLMYNFHYNFMLKNVERDNIDLLMTDTDSLCYHIKRQDIFEIMNNNRSIFDMSNYEKGSFLYDNTNNKVMGKFKNESVKSITEFVGLRAKLYSFTAENDKKKHNKCKGVKSCFVKTELTIDDYRNTLYNRTSKSIKQNNIRSYGHELFTERIEKIALSYNDDKVFFSDDNVHTFNHGHWRNKKI